MTPLTFIKLGGAVITHKEQEGVLREDVLDRLVLEIANVIKTTKKKLVIGNGAGSFGHHLAHKYQTMHGFKSSSEGGLGMAMTQDAVARLNRIVVGKLISQGIPAVTCAISNSAVTENKKPVALFTEVIEEYLRQGLVPVVYGDVIVDRKIGCTVWSTDTIFCRLGEKLLAQGWQIDTIFHVTEAAGVWKNKQQDIYPLITRNHISQVKKQMLDTKGADVTGGMWHKIESSLELARFGVKTRILSGLVPGNLQDALMTDKVIGTTIA